MMKAPAHQFHRRYTVVWLLAVLLMATSVRADDPSPPAPGDGPLPDNFGRMEEWLYRGAVPDQEQLRSLARLGIRTVLDLRYTAERGYGAHVRQLGMEYIRIPLRPRSVPSEELLELYLSLLANTGNRPVYVHCRKGKHRAGLMLALFRVLHQGRAPKEALAEMQIYGFGRGHRRMVAFFHCRTSETEDSPTHGG